MACEFGEIAIKHGLTRTGMPISGEQALSWFEEAGYIILAVTGAHAAAVGGLRPVHADPFDRIIVAQALTEPSRLLTHDKTVALYSDTIVLV